MGANKPRDREPRECDRCGEDRPDVKFDPGTGRELCNACWLKTPPSGPASR